MKEECSRKEVPRLDLQETSTFTKKESSFDPEQYRMRRKQLLNEVLSRDEEEQMKLMGDSILRKFS
eukprot:CAMPEP_0168345908 /NCGR_PEP_ID=MMETSP0213-20121227/17889_1 /TAXON_ID=151035 /ORGANISM="Euplotes harpa, Strain FSP1.4" /LENGTH=65 /DNA_ID=CAMNT_0008354325 /DNA_START=78 /DNA_END=271 /DNA_ORIENTATION=+